MLLTFLLRLDPNYRLGSIGFCTPTSSQSPRVCTPRPRFDRGRLVKLSATHFTLRLRLATRMLRRAIRGHRSPHRFHRRRRSQIYKRGYVFRRGPLVIQMFQQEQVCHCQVISAKRCSVVCLGRSEDAEAYNRPPRHALGGGSTYGGTCTQHSRDSSEQIHRGSSGSATTHERFARPQTTRRLSGSRRHGKSARIC